MKLACETCGVAIPPANVNLAEGVCFCAACQEYFKIVSLFPEEAGTAPTKPGYSRIELVSDRNSLGLIVPAASDRSLGRLLTVMAIFWNAITWTIIISIVLHGPRFTLFPLSIFVAVGIVLIGVALFSLRGEFTLSLDHRECRAIWSLFRWNIARRAATAEILDVTDVVVYTKNYKPVYGVGIRHGSRTLKFGSNLTEDERKWIIGEIRRFLKSTGSRARCVPTAAVIGRRFL